MKKKGSNKKRIIAIIIVAVAAAAFLLWWFLLRGRTGGKNQEVAYVEKVSVLIGQEDSAGLVNRYAGVVEAQESWSVKQNSDAKIKEMLVKVGDSVKKGDSLFTYDIDKYNSDLEQAEIDQERLENELETAKETVTQLEKEKKAAKASEQANFTIQIKEQELTVKQTELDIESKKIEVQKLKDNIEHATVTSEIDGVVKSINTGETEEDSLSGDGEDSLITIMQTGNLRIKGTINEQNINSLGQGASLIVRSRTDPDQTWKGVISKVDTERTDNSQNNAMYGNESGSGSTSYPFYVTLDSSEGLMIGQHVYMELDQGQLDEDKKDGIWLYDYMFDMTDASHPFVWADKNGKLEKREIKLGAYDEDLMAYEIVSGLALEDAIAMPDERLREGMITKPMAEIPTDGGEFDEDGEEMLSGDDEEDEIEFLDEDDEDLDPDYEGDEDDDNDWGTEEGFEGMDGYQSMEGMDRGDPSMDDISEDPEDSLNAVDAEWDEEDFEN